MSKSCSSVTLSLRCREISSSMLDYLDGSLPPEEAAMIEEHMRLCPDCACFKATYVATTDLASKAFSRALTETQRALLCTKLRDALRSA
ncbi:zf-HC2 domain-containing protein [Myxococcota bacterium]|nr:zf-HC2 domain-containing protein [Myxococcota bacterium]